MRRTAVILLLFIAAMLFLMVVPIGCKTVKVTPSEDKNTAVKETEAKGTKVTSADSLSELISRKPATRNKVEFEPTLDDSGNFVPTTLRSVSGTDSLTVKTEGKKVIVESNCAEQISYWIRQVHIKDSMISVLKTKDSSHSVEKRIPYPVPGEKEVVKETPWYMWLLIGAMALTILYLLTRKIFT